MAALATPISRIVLARRLARGKEHHDKRDSIREAESKREIDRVMKARNRSRA